MKEFSVTGRVADFDFGKRPAIGKVAAIGLKILVTIFCFWYIARQIDVSEFFRRAHTIDMAWASLATVAILAQIPLVTLRWCAIIDALSHGGVRIARGPVLAITAIGIFFGQVLPYAAGDAVRVVMLTRLIRDWRQAAVGVVIDRGIGVAVLAAFGFVILLFPSALTALGGHRNAALEVFGFAAAAFMIGLVAAPSIAPFLDRWAILRWIGNLVLATHNVLLRSNAGASIVALAAAIHLLTILSVWCTGLALGMSFSLLDSAVLFTLMVAAALVPVSFGGWGVREVAVVALLTSQGLPAEQALFFSVCFGVIVVIGSMPGALVLAVYSLPDSAARA